MAVKLADPLGLLGKSSSKKGLTEKLSRLVGESEVEIEVNLPEGTMEIADTVLPVLVGKAPEGFPDEFRIELTREREEGETIGRIINLETGETITESALNLYFQAIPLGGGIGVGPVMIESDLFPQFLGIAIGSGSPFLQVFPPGGFLPPLELDLLPQIPLIPVVAITA